MNEKTAKKIGEAHAFAVVTQNLCNDHRDTMQALFDNTQNIIDTTANQIQQLDAIVSEHNMGQVVAEKSLKTVEKINRMADMYVGDEWDNPVEVLEWMSFFLGGAIVHWDVITGSGAGMGDVAFEDAARVGAEDYHELFHSARDKAQEIGRKRVED